MMVHPLSKANFAVSVAPTLPLGGPGKGQAGLGSQSHLTKEVLLP